MGATARSARSWALDMGEIGIVCREEINRVPTAIALLLPVPQSPCLCGVFAPITGAYCHHLILLFKELLWKTDGFDFDYFDYLSVDVCFDLKFFGMENKIRLKNVIKKINLKDLVL